MALVEDRRLATIYRELHRLKITSSLTVIGIEVPTMPVPIEVDRVERFQQALHAWMTGRPESGHYYFDSAPMQKDGQYANKRKYNFYLTCGDITEDLRNFCFEARLRYM